jgi:hypothetical protein
MKATWLATIHTAKWAKSELAREVPKALEGVGLGATGLFLIFVRSLPWIIVLVVIAYFLLS